MLACWSDFIFGSPVVKTAVSANNGNTWSTATVVSQSGRLCSVGGNNTQAAVTWYDDGSKTLFWAISSDGTRWTPYILDSVPTLVSGSTTDKVLAGPYALVMPAGTGLRAVYQIRDSGISKVFVRDLVVGSQRLPIGGSEQVEKFLPGAGTFCGQFVGSYQVTSDGITFRYAGWYTTASSSPLFVSGSDLNGKNGFPSGYNDVSGKINDYTGADCSKDGFGWLAWTDLRSGVPGQPQIWATRIPLE